MDLDRPLALDHAGIAGVALLQDRLGERGAVDVLGLREGALGVVPRGLAARLVLDGEHARRAVFPEPHDAGVGFLQLLEALDETAELLGRRGLGTLRAADDHGLQALRSHHRAQSRAAVGAVDHVHDGGEADEVLTGGPDLRDLRLRIADLLLEHAIRVGRHLAPQMPGGLELCLAVVQPEVDGLLGLPREDEGIGARRPHLGREEAAALAVADGAREGRARAGGHAALPRDGEAGQRAHGHDEDVVGSERIGARRDLLEEEICRERAPARVLSVYLLGERRLLDAALAEIDVVHSAGECQGGFSSGCEPGRLYRPARVSRQCTATRSGRERPNLDTEGGACPPRVIRSAAASRGAVPPA